MDAFGCGEFGRLIYGRRVGATIGICIRIGIGIGIYIRIRVGIRTRCDLVFG